MPQNSKWSGEGVIVIKKLEARKHLLIALDISSTSVGMCIHCDGRTESSVVDLKKFKGDGWCRITLLASNVQAAVMEAANAVQRGDHDAVDIFVEQPFYSAGTSHDTPIKMAHGAILAELARYYGTRIHNYEQVSVNSWRSWFLGKELNKKGVDKKIAVKEKIKEKYGRVIESDDEADAIGLMAWVLENRFKKVGDTLWRR